MENILTKKNEVNLTEKDLKSSKKIIKKGDIALIGSNSIPRELIFGKVFSHSAVYVGDNDIVHANIKGVTKESYSKLFLMYDNLAILRSKVVTPTKMKYLMLFLESQVGKSYDYNFKPNNNQFYCTELIIDMYKKYGYRLNLEQYVDHNILPNVPRASDFLYAKTFFDIVFVSENISQSKIDIANLKNLVKKNKTLKL